MSGGREIADDELVSICRDENCPECDWPETYSEVIFGEGVKAIGCRKCGWREVAS